MSLTGAEEVALPRAPVTSRAVARLLGVSYDALYRSIRVGIISAPEKDDSGRYWWTPGDVERARHALRHYRPRPRREPAVSV